ncbi:MAG TPA: ADOP family duplicated permease [Gemmatimonadaceae bacterium]|nr:ADOP family duplicated permease [Gemmatimonadaceae bacterium]
MHPPDHDEPHRWLPALPLALLRLLLPRPERDEVIADLAAEFAQHAAAGGRAAARRWVWRQALASAPALLGWNWWRGWSGFEPRANAYRPGGLMLKHWMADARYTARRLRARPVYTLVAVLTLALGVGGTAAVFGIARPLMFEPLPYAHASEVGMFWMPGWWYEAEFSEMRGRFSGFRNVAAYRPADVTMRQGNSPARLVPGIATSVELFDVLGARPFLGRGFHAGEDVRGAAPVAVISYGLWQELGGTPAVVGTRLILDGTPTTVVGVMPRGFWFPDPSVRIWRPQPINPQRMNGSFTLVGRVAPGHDVRHMDAEMHRIVQTLAVRFASDYFGDADKRRAPALTPLRDALVGSMRPALMATLAAMGLILLIACANVAALMLGQVEGRASELAVRSALGANRRRLVQQLVIEALLLGLGAGLLGAALAAAGFHLLAGALPIGAWAERAAFDWQLFAAALGIALVAVLLVVLVPAMSLWRGDLRIALSGARTGGIQGRGGRLERGLVVAEVALAMLIASGAALLVRSVSNLYAIDPGVDTQHIAVVDLLSSPTMHDADRARVVRSLLAELGSIPSVRSVAATAKLPLRGAGDSFGMRAEGHPEMSQVITYFRIVSPGYFKTMGIALRQGRAFDVSDPPMIFDSAAQADSTREASIVVNETLARTFFPGENPIGRHLLGGFDQRQRIVGVVSNVAEAGLTDAPAPTAYYLGDQVGWESGVSLVLRTARPQDASGVLDAARRIVQRVAPDMAVQQTTTMARVFDTAVGPARQVMSLLTVLSALALVLGAVGIYGVISHFAARRQRDWAIRVALGLPGSRVVRHIVGQGAALVGVGVVLGAIGTAVLARLLASLLFGVSAIDPLAFAAASGALLVIGVIAAFVPAWRAGSVDPALVLREQ